MDCCLYLMTVLFIDRLCGMLTVVMTAHGLYLFVWVVWLLTNVD